MSKDKQLEDAWKVEFPLWFWGKLPFDLKYEIFLFHKLEWGDGMWSGRRGISKVFAKGGFPIMRFPGL